MTDTPQRPDVEGLRATAGADADRAALCDWVEHLEDDRDAMKAGLELALARIAQLEAE